MRKRTSNTLPAFRQYFNQESSISKAVQNPDGTHMHIRAHANSICCDHKTFTVLRVLQGSYFDGKAPKYCKGQTRWKTFSTKPIACVALHPPDY